MDGAEKTGRRQREVWLGCAITVVLLPVVYVGSLVVLVAFFEWTKLTPPDWLSEFLYAFYSPLRYLAHEWKWFGEALDWIFERLISP